MIPLLLRLKKAKHREIAKAQDIIVDETFNIFDSAVMHGGTAIWRCYHGNRFSEDIDVYLIKDKEKIDLFYSNLVKKGFIIEKKKISENSIYSNLNMNGTIVRFEVLFRKIKGHLKEYETSDGNFLTINTLFPEEFINEKVNTYLNRLKIRDLYDIFLLLRYVDNKEDIKKSISRLTDKFKKPIDEPELNTIIIEGLVPSTQKMLEYIRSFK